MTTRRTFLRLGLGAAGAMAATGLGVHPLQARSGGERDACKLVIMMAYGGWDVMWTLDPKPDSPEVDLIPGDVQMFGDLPIWTDVTRPAVTEFFMQWGDRAAAINGIAVESLAHETCAKVMLTGAVGSEPDLGARVADALASNLALPYLALSPHAKTYGSDALVGELGDVNQLMMLAAPELGWPAPGRATADLGLEFTASERALITEHLERAAGRQTAAPHLSPRGSKMLADYITSLRRADELQASARAGGVLSDPALVGVYDSPWDHVARALAEDLSQVALVQPDLFWDTHAYNATQGAMHDDFFAGLNALMRALSTHGIVDETVVLVISEMGRTPRHNATGGKDHWPWTSALLVGAGVAGGRAYGATDEWLKPGPIDLNSGAPESTGTRLHAEHVLHATASLVGAPTNGWFTREAFHALLV